MIKLILKNAWMFALLAMVTATSCDKVSDLTDELTDEQITETYVDQAVFSIQQDGNLGRKGCFELVFPVTLEFPDGDSVTVENYEELIQSIREWKEANPDADQRPSLVFPIEVMTEDGEIISIENREELHELKKECRREYFNNNGPNGHHGNCTPCFTIVFPLEVEFPNGEIIEVNNRVQLKMLIRQWKQNHPNVDVRPHIVFPIEVEMEDGTIVTVNSKEELKELKDGCD